MTRAILRMAALAGLAVTALTTSVQAQNAITLTGTALDAADDNRFLTRLGGAMRDELKYTGLTTGETYTVTAQLFDLATQQPVGDPVAQTFTAEASEGDLTITVPVDPNRTEFNIDYASLVKLYAGDMAEGAPLATLEDTEAKERVIQVHAIQRISVTANDASDGDRELDPNGGAIQAEVNYENLVEGYKYTIWGQLLTPSGQSTGVYANVAEFAPEGKNGTLSLTFDVPERFEGIKLVPSVGLFHHNRVTIREDGLLLQNEGAPNPVMIASDPDLDDPEKTIRIGVPFEETN